MHNILKYQNGTGKAGVTSGPTQGSLQAKKDAWAANSLPKVQPPKMPENKAVQLNPPTINPPVGSGPTTARQKAASLLGKAGWTPNLASRVVDAGTDYLSESILGTKRDDSLNQSQKKAQDMLISATGLIPGVGVPIKYGLKALNTLQYATNSQVDAMSKNMAKTAGVGGLGRIVNNTVATLPANFLGALTGSTDDAYISQETANMGSSFADTLDQITDTQDIGAKNFLIGKKKANAAIANSNRNNDILTLMGRANTMRKDNTISQDIASANNRLYAGSSYASDRTYVGKQGMKMTSLKEAQEILKATQVKEEEVPAFQNGGVIGVDTNILPEGALHAHKNHLEEVNEGIGSQVTEKGIPVVVTDEEGKPKQVAEIERTEVVLNKSLTEKLEELWHQWQNTEDNEERAGLCEEAGKLLAVELIENTESPDGKKEELING